MADETTETTGSSTPFETGPATPVDATASAEDVVEAELVDPAAVEQPVVAPLVADPAPAAGQPNQTGAQPQYVVVEAPRLPKQHGNRGIGSLLALLGAVIFGGLLVGGTYLLGLASATAGDVVTFSFLGNLKFYLPVVVFAIAFVLLVLIVNRGAWWAYILGSLVVGIVVYLGTALAGAGIDQALVGLDRLQPSEAGTVADGLRSPFVILAAILAREVAIWWGSLVAHRGRRMKAKNRVAREAFDQQLADFHQKYGAPAR